jgi:hypothetical protein
MNRDRFQDAGWLPEPNTDVLIVGAGGTGSFLTFFLASSGFNCHVFDFDKVDEVNTGSQLFGEKYIGTSKVVAIFKVVKEFCNETINIYNKKYVKGSMVCPIVFSCIDTMAARRDLFSNWNKHYGKNPKAIFIDGRLLPDDIRVFSIIGGAKRNIKDFLENRLPLDSEVPDTICSYKQTRDSSALLAINMQNRLKNHTMNLRQKTKGFSVPYYTKEILPLGLLTVKQKS